MKNIVFISPNFPQNYWKFCHNLRADGLNVLGIGDQPYDDLLPELKASLNEYYKVGSLENYDEVYRAMGFFIHKYGCIDWLESNNEYWLKQDAALRTDFNITSGFQNDDIPRIRFKSGMKEYYRRAGIPVARYHLVDDRQGCLAFIGQVGWPVIVKPDNGMGASDTRKLTDEADLDAFLNTRLPDVQYIMEEYIEAEINSYDAIFNSRGEPVFETGNITPCSIMDVVNESGNVIYHILKHLPDDTRAAGRAAAASFGVKSRFVHFEFFRLTKDHPGMGRTGDIVALEVNMRPSGGYSPDMMNFANSTDVYKIWADMIAFDRSTVPEGEHFYCAFVGRRDGRTFRLSHKELIRKYAANMKMTGRIPDALSGAMANQMFIATFAEKEDMERFYADALAPQD